jgi:hypothetical protein
MENSALILGEQSADQWIGGWSPKICYGLWSYPLRWPLFVRLDVVESPPCARRCFVRQLPLTVAGWCGGGGERVASARVSPEQPPKERRMYGQRCFSFSERFVPCVRLLLFWTCRYFVVEAGSHHNLVDILKPFYIQDQAWYLKFGVRGQVTLEEAQG